MVKEGLIEQLKASAEFFERSTRCLDEGDSGFVPADGVFSVVNQVAHTAQTVEWFMSGMFNDDGFDLDFEKHEREMKSCTSLSEARKWFERAMQDAISQIDARTDEEVLSPLPEGPILGGAPRTAIVGAIMDHTAHHRGALTVYSRLLGKTPLMPYAE
ncbi:MAG: DinB family protein [Acidobacteriota bacterium]|nr:MAG: DinB family protein [Acidobacteriota bacterium]